MTAALYKNCFALSATICQLLLTLETVSAKGQIIGQMNEVDEDNNVVGDQPFLGMTVSKKNSTLQTLRSILSFLLMVAILVIASYGLYMLYKWY